LEVGLIDVFAVPGAVWAGLGLAIVGSAVLGAGIVHAHLSRRLNALLQDHETYRSGAELRERKLKESLREAQAIGAGLSSALEETRAALAESERRIAELEAAQQPEAPSHSPRLQLPGGPAEQLPGTPPARLDAPRGGRPDDLTRIAGIGCGTAELLNDIGVYHLAQIAAWEAGEIAHVEALLQWDAGPVTRDDWVGQARALSGTGPAEFSNVEDNAEGD